MARKNKSIRKPRGYKIRPRAKKAEKPAQPTRKPTLIGYMRVSTEKQEHALQYNALIEYGILSDNIFQDTISGSKVNRKGRDACLKFMVEGDMLCVWKLDRFSRSIADTVNQLEGLKKRGITFVSLTEGIDTSTAMGEVIMHFLSILSQLERENIKQRVKAGIKAKRDSGKITTWGRRPAVEYDKEEIKRLILEGKSQREIAKITGISKSTVSNINKEMNKIN